MLCHMAGLGIGPELGNLKLELIGIVGYCTGPSELARTGCHWNRNWPGVGLGGLRYIPGSNQLSTSI